ncbi:hypothetical protein ACR9HT_01900 [Enterobacter wuhouensis]
MKNNRITAKVLLTVPADIMNYIATNPRMLEGITTGDAKVLNNNVQWDAFVYALSLADNGKDISVSYEYANRDYISESLAGVTILVMNKNELEKAGLTKKRKNVEKLATRHQLPRRLLPEPASIIARPK